MVDPERQSENPDPDWEVTPKFPWKRAIPFSLGIGILGLGLWIAITLIIRFPLIPLPMAIGLGIGYGTRKYIEIISVVTGILCAGIAAVIAIVGNFITTLILGSSDGETTTSISDMIAYLKTPGNFSEVLAYTFTPMDILVVIFVAGAAYCMAAMPFHKYEIVAEHQELPMGAAIAKVQDQGQGTENKPETPENELSDIRK